MCDFPLPAPVESPPVEAPRMPVPPPRMPDRVVDDEASIAGTVGGVVASALTTGKKAAMFLISHPATPYAVGLTAALGLCYYGYKWFTSGDNESAEDNQSQERPQEDDSKDKDE